MRPDVGQLLLAAAYLGQRTAVVLPSDGRAALVWKKDARDPDAVDRCLRTIELALRLRRSREEAIAALDRYFAQEIEPVTLDSSVYDLGLPLRLAHILDGQGIETARQLKTALESGKLALLKNIGPVAIRECQEALARIR
jgi:hypothetical protein